MLYTNQLSGLTYNIRVGPSFDPGPSVSDENRRIQNAVTAKCANVAPK